jgi:hypothetical protein
MQSHQTKKRAMLRPLRLAETVLDDLSNADQQTGVT